MKTPPIKPHAIVTLPSEKLLLPSDEAAKLVGQILKGTFVKSRWVRDAEVTMFYKDAGETQICQIDPDKPFILADSYSDYSDD